MNRICLHGDIAKMTVALYRAEDQVAMLQRLAYLAAESDEPADRRAGTAGGDISLTH